MIRGQFYGGDDPVEFLRQVAIYCAERDLYRDAHKRIWRAAMCDCN